MREAELSQFLRELYDQAAKTAPDNPRAQLYYMIGSLDSISARIIADGLLE